MYLRVSLLFVMTAKPLFQRRHELFGIFHLTFHRFSLTIHVYGLLIGEHFLPIISLATRSRSTFASTEYLWAKL